MSRLLYSPRLVLLVLLVAVLLRGYEWVRRSGGMVPWGRLVLADRIGPFTSFKIDRLHDAPEQCIGVLREGAERFDRAAVVRQGPQCGYENGVRLLSDRNFSYRPAATTSCPVAVGLSLWERQIVQPAAIEHFGVPVASVETLGAYSCRRIGGGNTGSFSEHATANAIDIAAFTLADGRRVSVIDDWHGDGAAARFLRETRDGACDIFATTLSPDYNAAHRDHLHFDQARRNGYRFCR